SRPGRSRLNRRQRHPALRPGGPRRIDHHRPRCHSRRTGRRRRPLHRRRRGHRHRSKRNPRRRRSRQSRQRLSCHRQSPVAALRGPHQPATGASAQLKISKIANPGSLWYIRAHPTFQMSDLPETRNSNSSVSLSPPRVRVLLLDDEPDNLFLRATILRQHGYDCIPASTIEEATELFNSIDIAVLDYHLGAGQFGTEAANLLRRRRPHVPIIILSATLERFFGGAEDMHLLKGHSSVEDILSALSALEAKRRGSPVVVDARDFFYSRIAMA